MYKAWKAADKPRKLHDPLLVAKKNPVCTLGKPNVRIELAQQNSERNERIMVANLIDKKLFFRLIRKQRQPGNSFIDDLYVGDTVFENELILDGWLKHFKTLANPVKENNFDYDFLSVRRRL